MKALRVKKTGELFRVLVSGHSFGWMPSEGVPVPCYNALLHKSKGSAKRKEYDRMISIVYKSSLYDFCETDNDAIEPDEKRRAKEIICKRFHLEKCGPLSYEEYNAVPVASVAGNGDYWFKNGIRLLRELEEYLEGGKRMEPTKLASLRFDLKNFNSWIKKNEGKTDGM